VNNSATETTTVNTQADLRVTKSDSPDPVLAGNNITYTLTVTNSGPSDAQTVALSDTLPAGTTFVSLSQGSGATFACTTPAVGATGTVSCTRATLAATASQTFTLVVKVGASVANGSTITNTASATSTTTDPDPVNSSATAMTQVATSADLVVTKTDSPDPVYYLNNLTYSISITNNGPSDAQTVALSDTLPAGTTFVSLSQGSGATFVCTTPAVGATGTVSCTRTTLAALAGQTFTLVVKVTASAPSSITNTAGASSTTSDPNAGNNSAPATTNVNQRLVQLTYTGASSAQYSDPVAAKATLMDVTDPSSPTPIPGKTITFTLGVQTFTAVTDATGTAATSLLATAISDRLNQPAGSKTIGSAFAGDTVYPSASDSDPYLVNLEDADVTMITPSVLSISTATTNANVELTVVERADGYPSSDFTTAAPSGLFGLDNARPIQVVAGSVTNGSTAAICYANDTTRTANPNIALAHCTLNSLGPDVYELTATIQGDYFQGGGVGALTVYNPALGFTTGGGWYTDPTNGYRYNFGFNAKILKSGQVQGSLLTIVRTPQGVYEVKSNAMGGLIVAPVKDGAGNILYYSATFSGKANYSIPPSQGLLWCGARKCGDYRFTVYVEDRKEPGGGFDRFWIQVLNSPTATGGFANKPVPLFYMASPAAGSTGNAVTIDNGNIQVPQPQSLTK
jgi:uncharacterized repeat protein (TIGR01451 family)